MKPHTVPNKKRDEKKNGKPHITKKKAPQERTLSLVLSGSANYFLTTCFVPEGETRLCLLLCINACFLLLHAFLRPPWVFSRALGCGERRGGACTLRLKFVSRPGSVACALGVRNREISQIITGSLSAELEPSTTMENPHVSCFAPIL